MMGPVITIKTVTVAALAILAATTMGAACSSGSEVDREPDAVPAAVREFGSFAVDGRSAVSWADVVTFGIEGQPVARLDAARADRRAAWQGCPSGATTTYEGRDCPVSPLRAIRLLVREGGALVFETEAPDVVGCNRYEAPASGQGRTTAWIRPDVENRDCFSDFAIAVALDSTGRIAAVDLAMSGP